jgi:hypothetical protein
MTNRPSRGPINRWRRAACALPLLLAAGGLTASDDPFAAVTSIESTQVTAPPPLPPVPHKDTGNEWVVAPIPSLTPSQGAGLAIVGQYIFKSEKQSADTPSSIVAAGGFFNEQDSWGAFVGYLGHWQDDRWRPIFGAGYLDVNYDFYGIGNPLAQYDRSVPISQQATAGFAQLMRRIIPGLYGGLRLMASKTEASSAGRSDPVIGVAPLSLKVDTTSFGPVFQWDTRDNQFYPTSGQAADFSAIFNEGDDSYQIYQFDWNTYTPLGDGTVLASRFYARSSVGDVPFYALSQFGMHNDLRGYETGKYRDNDMFAVQVEYRRKLGGRWGLVVFAGAGEVMEGFDDINTDDLLASVGAGLRFQLAKTHPVNFRLDWAYGRDGPAVYLGVGEAF